MCTMLLFIAGINTMIQSNLGEERVYLSYMLSHVTIHHSRRKLEAGTEAETMKELYLLASFGLLSYLS